MQKKEQSFHTKQRLADALKELLEFKPLNKIRIRELTDPCGIYRQTFYHHFTDLESLLLWSIQQDVDQMRAYQTDALTWQERIEEILRYTAEHRGYLLAVLENNAYPAQRQALQNQMAALLSEFFAEQNVQLQLPVENYVTIVFSVLEQWVRGTLRQSEEDTARFFTELLGEPYIPRNVPLAACLG